MVRWSPHVKILRDFGEVVFFVGRDGEIADDCDLVVFHLLAGIGFEDDMVESMSRTVRIGGHGESCCSHLLCCPFAEMFVTFHTSQ